MYEDLPGYDMWKTTPPEPRPPKIATCCHCCHVDMYEGEECYYIDGEYYCDDCVIEAKVTLDRVDE